ncbi:MAG TPA: polysaccharide deacetylase family protein [Thiolinea sp.]|nr:polysaccharide deacetylase family protein [Thiolinea sp.]
MPAKPDRIASPATGTLPPPGPALSILMYHQVGRFPSPSTHRALYCHVDRFRAQLAYLKYMRFTVMDLGQVCACLFGGQPLPPRAVALTFDDGFADFRTHAWPLLQAYGFPATVFAISALIGRRASWMTGAEFPEPAALLDGKALRELQQEGLHIGSHAMTHQRLSQLTPPQARAEVFDSKAALEDLLGVAIADFCYPYGDYTPQVRDLVQEAGYRAGLTCIRAAANHAHNPFELPRKAISYGDSLAGYAWKLHVKHARKH